MKHITTTALALSLLTGSASAQTVYSNVIPPKEFDRPYTGELWIVTLNSVASPCETSSNTACTTGTDSNPTGMGVPVPVCFLYTLPKKTVNAFGPASWAMMLRHELGHCNGWQAEHPDGVETFTNSQVEMPKLPPQTHWLPLYDERSPVCVTPEWKIEPCKSRRPTS